MTHFLLRLVLAATALVALRGAAAADVAPPVTLTLGMHQTVALPGSSARLTFIHAIDHRCPRDGRTECLHPGWARALVWFELGDLRRVLVVDQGRQAPVDGLSNRTSGWELCFVGLEPSPRPGQPVRPQDLVLQVRVHPHTATASACGGVT